MSNPVGRREQAGHVTESLPSWERAANVEFAFRTTALHFERLSARAEREPENSASLLAEALCALERSQAQLAAARDLIHAQSDELLESRLDRELEWTRYRDLFESAPLPYLETDLQGLVIESNRSLSAFLGVSPEHLIGKPLIGFVAQSDRRAYRRTLELLKLGAPKASLLLNLCPRGRYVSVPARLDLARVSGTPDHFDTVRWMFVPADEPAAATSPESEQASAHAHLTGSTHAARMRRSRHALLMRRRPRVSTREHGRTRR